MQRLRPAIAAVAVSAAIFAAAPPARACQCRAQTPAEQFAAATAVFEARVVAIEPSEFAGRPCGGFCPNTIVRMRVTRHWKGAPAADVVVYTDTNDMCALQYTIGSTYLVYASGLAAGRYTVDGCGGTRPLGDAAEHLRALGAGTRVP
jgi:hypothetical protein